MRFLFPRPTSLDNNPCVSGATLLVLLIASDALHLDKRHSICFLQMKDQLRRNRT